MVVSVDVETAVEGTVIPMVYADAFALEVQGVPSQRDWVHRVQRMLCCCRQVPLYIPGLPVGSCNAHKAGRTTGLTNSHSRTRVIFFSSDGFDD